MIDVGMDYETAVKATGRLILPVGRYELQVSEIRPSNTQEGRPQWGWEFNILNSDTHPEFIGRKIFINSVLPWLDPSTGKIDTSGLFVLIGNGKNDAGILGGIGKRWQGNSFDDTPQLYIGTIGKADVKVSIIKKGTYAGQEQNTFAWIAA